MTPLTCGMTGSWLWVFPKVYMGDYALCTDGWFRHVCHPGRKFRLRTRK